MLMAFYVTLCEKTFQGSGLGASCIPISSDGNVTVMVKDPDVKVGHSCLREWEEMYVLVDACIRDPGVCVTGLDADVSDGCRYFLR